MCEAPVVGRGCCRGYPSNLAFLAEFRRVLIGPGHLVSAPSLNDAEVFVFHSIG